AGGGGRGWGVGERALGGQGGTGNARVPRVGERNRPRAIGGWPPRRVPALPGAAPRLPQLRRLRRDGPLRLPRAAGRASPRQGRRQLLRFLRLAKRPGAPEGRGPAREGAGGAGRPVQEVARGPATAATWSPPRSTRDTPGTRTRPEWRAPRAPRRDGARGCGA